jgi:23S rRNA (uracil1939-C5)-methyltransferase
MKNRKPPTRGQKARRHANERHPAGAKAPIAVAALAAPLDPAQGRLFKSCPDAKLLAAAAKSSAKEGGAQSAARDSANSSAQLVEIEKPVYGGAFLAHVEGKAVFVPLTLPGEQARIRVTQSKSGYSTAEAVEIVAASPARVQPRCPHFGACGGCNYQHAGYENELAFKQQILRETLERGGVAVPEKIETLAAEPWAYRNRIRLAFDAEGRPGYRGRKSHGIVPISQCPIAAPLLVCAAQAAGEMLERVPANLRPKELALFCDAAESTLMATFFAGDTAGVRLEPLAAALKERIAELKSAQLAADGRPGHPARMLARWGADSIRYSAAGFDYRVDQGAFFQVNRWLVDALVERVTRGASGKLAWDMFAGVGLFARRLTANFERVVAVESAPPAVEALDENLKGTTGTGVRAATLDFLRSAASSQGPDWIVPDLIIVDPPRSGLGADVTALLAQVASAELVYVSCDPATLARDLRALVASGYEIESVTLADLFPQTFHMETIVRLRRCVRADLPRLRKME